MNDDVVPAARDGACGRTWTGTGRRLLLNPDPVSVVYGGVESSLPDQEALVNTGPIRISPQYKAIHPERLPYSRFCEQYREWAGKLDLVMRHEHRGGEKLFIAPRGGPRGLRALRWSRWFGPLKGFVKVYSGSEITPSSSVSSLVIDDDEALWSCGNLAVPTQAWAATIAREISNGRWAPASPTSGVGATLSGRPRDGQIHSVRWDMLSGPALS